MIPAHMLTQHPPSASQAPAESRPSDINLSQQHHFQPTEAIELGELSKEVQACVTRRVQQLPLIGPYTTDTSSDEEAGTVPARYRSTYLKSNRLHTIDSQILHKVDWPHMHIYLADGKPAEYESLTVSLWPDRSRSWRCRPRTSGPS